MDNENEQYLKTDKPAKMSDTLKTKVEQMTPFMRKYCEYRAKGLKQSESAEKAGSKASDKAALGRVGYNTEQMDGVKEYIVFLSTARAKSASIDEIEIVNKLRRVYEEAMDANKFADANKATELLGNMIGAFKKEEKVITSKVEASKNNTKAFKEDEADSEQEITADRLTKIRNMVNDLQK